MYTIHNIILLCTLTHLMPSFSNILMVGSSFASTTTRSGSNISTFMESHLEDIHRGWLSGIKGWGAVTNYASEKKKQNKKLHSNVAHTQRAKISTDFNALFINEPLY